MKHEWQMDDVVEFDEHPNLQFVLWESWPDERWQIQQVYSLTENLQTVNFAGVIAGVDLEKAKFVGRWSDSERRVIPVEVGA